MALLPGSGGRLLFRPLHLHLPHAGLPLLQEGRHRLQGQLSAAPYRRGREAHPRGPNGGIIISCCPIIII